MLLTYWLSISDSMGLNLEWNNRECITTVGNCREIQTEKYYIKLLSEIEFDKFVRFKGARSLSDSSGFIRRWYTLLHVHMGGIKWEWWCCWMYYMREYQQRRHQCWSFVFRQLGDNHARSWFIQQQNTWAQNLRMFILTGRSNAIQMTESDFGIKCSYTCTVKSMKLICAESSE